MDIEKIGDQILKKSFNCESIECNNIDFVVINEKNKKLILDDIHEKYFKKLFINKLIEKTKKENADYKLLYLLKKSKKYGFLNYLDQITNPNDEDNYIIKINRIKNNNSNYILIQDDYHYYKDFLFMQGAWRINELKDKMLSNECNHLSNYAKLSKENSSMNPIDKLNDALLKDLFTVSIIYLTTATELICDHIEELENYSIEELKEFKELNHSF